MRRIVYIDMDGVLCDYHGEYSRRIIINPENKFPQAEWGFFIDLPLIDGAKDGINAVAKFYDTWILTRPSIKNPLCYTEKRVWVEQQLGMKWVKKLIISPNKGLLRGDYLIDDQPWPNFKGEQLRFGTKDCPDWKYVLKYLGAKW
jgi:5'(3')-deoxyribonucleotidase